MLVNFNEMPLGSRVWIYQAKNPLSINSSLLLEEVLNSFISNWESHDNPLKASWKLYYDQFLIIAVDESFYPASGCSIDKSVQLIKDLEIQLENELLGKTTLAILESRKIFTFELKDLKKVISEQKITSKTI